MIKVKSLTVFYKKVRALNNISFVIKKGDIIALAGQNGAGKSTLLNCLIGLKTPTSGTVTINGSIGWMSETSEPDPELKVIEYISFSAYLKDSVYLSNLLNRCGLDTYKDRLCKDLSKGLKQRVLLAGALAGNPDILILDEPSAGLDPLFQNEMISLIKTISKDITIILSTHNISEIKSLAGDVIILKDGQISFNGKTEGELYYEYF